MNPSLFVNRGLKIVGSGTLPDPALWPDGVGWVDESGDLYVNSEDRKIDDSLIFALLYDGVNSRTRDVTFVVGDGVTISNNTLQFYSSAFDSNGISIFQNDDLPNIDKITTFDGGSNASIVIDDSASLIDSTHDFSYEVTFYTNSLTSGYIVSKAGNDYGKRTGLYFSAGSLFNAIFGNHYAISGVSANKLHRIAVTFEASVKQCKVYLDGVLKNTFDATTLTEDPSIPIQIGSRLDASMNPTYNLSGGVHSFRLYDKVLTASDVYSSYYNLYALRQIVVIGSSTAYGTGATSESKSWVGLSFSNLFSSRIANIINLGVGGTTIYSGAPDDYTNPSYVTGDRPSPNASINANRAIYYGADSVICNYASNFATLGYIEGINVYDEYIDGLTAIKNYCESNNCQFQTTTPSPLGLIASTATRYRLLLTANASLSLLSAIDTYTPVSDSADNYLLDEFDYGDGIHRNDEGHRVLFGNVINYLKSNFNKKWVSV